MIAIALDDEPIAIQIIESFAEQIPELNLQKTFTKVSEAQKFIKRFPVDLIFLDINMPEMNGLEFYESLPQKIMVIFTTAYSDFAVKGFELNAVDYLVKPFSFERFQEAVQRAFSAQKAKKALPISKQKPYLLIRADYQLQKIEFDQIELVESLADYIKIKLSGNKSITVRMTMKSIFEKLPKADFIRVHRSFIIPIRKIQSIRNKVIYLDDMEIQIGHSYENEVALRFSDK